VITALWWLPQNMLINGSCFCKKNGTRAGTEEDVTDSNPNCPEYPEPLFAFNAEILFSIIFIAQKLGRFI